MPDLMLDAFIAPISFNVKMYYDVGIIVFIFEMFKKKSQTGYFEKLI